MVVSAAPRPRRPGYRSRRAGSGARPTRRRAGAGTVDGGPSSTPERSRCHEPELGASLPGGRRSALLLAGRSGGRLVGFRAGPSRGRAPPRPRRRPGPAGGRRRPTARRSRSRATASATARGWASTAPTATPPRTAGRGSRSSATTTAAPRSRHRPEPVLSVRLQALDDRPYTAFVQDRGYLATNADGWAGRFPRRRGDRDPGRVRRVRPHRRHRLPGRRPSTPPAGRWSSPAATSSTAHGATTSTSACPASTGHARRHQPRRALPARRQRHLLPRRPRGR